MAIYFVAPSADMWKDNRLKRGGIFMPVQFECDNCEEESTQPPAQYKLSKFHFCSFACKKTFMNRDDYNEIVKTRQRPNMDEAVYI